MMEADIINIEVDTTILLGINDKGVVGNLRGAGADPTLNISNDKILTVKIYTDNLKSLRFNEDGYLIVSGFSTINNFDNINISAKGKTLLFRGISINII